MILVIVSYCRYEFPSQPELFAVDDSFMLGPSILMAPVLEEGATERNVTLPGGALWYDTATGALVRGSSSKSTQLTVPVTMDSIPSYIRGGSLIPSRERARRSSAATVHVSHLCLLGRLQWLNLNLNSMQPTMKWSFSKWNNKVKVYSRRCLVCILFLIVCAGVYLTL